MRIFTSFLLLFVGGPLLCEENSLLGYRLDWGNSKGNVFRTLEKRFWLRSIRFTWKQCRLLVSWKSPQPEIHTSYEKDMMTFPTWLWQKRLHLYIVNTRSLEHRRRKTIYSSKLTCLTLRFSEGLNSCTGTVSVYDETKSWNLPENIKTTRNTWRVERLRSQSILKTHWCKRSEISRLLKWHKKSEITFESNYFLLFLGPIVLLRSRRDKLPQVIKCLTQIGF